MAPGVETSFYNHDAATWILGWAQQVLLVTGSNGPWVWTISYGWPEAAECEFDTGICTDLGLDCCIQLLECHSFELMLVDYQLLGLLTCWRLRVMSDK